MSWSWRNFSVIFAVGTILVIVGLILAWYPHSVIMGLENSIVKGDLSQEDMWTHTGSLSWWRLAAVQLFGPLSNIVISLGGLIIIYGVSYSVFSIWNNTKTRKFKGREQIVEKTYVPTVHNVFSKQIKRSGFPITAGILSIIVSSILLALSFFSLSLVNNFYYYSNFYYLVAGIFDIFGFAFGLTAGILCLKRRVFPLAVIGISLLLVASVIMIILPAGFIFTIPLSILAILGLIFVSVSKQEFT
jgi:hypothetical protein